MSMRDPEDPRSDEDMQAEEEARCVWVAERPASYQSGWRALPPTMKQLDYLRKHGMHGAPTRGAASDLIGDIWSGTDRNFR